MESHIVSLLPSTTEIVCALGLRDRLVGRSHECDYPPDVVSLPACTSARLDDGSSRVIDDQVKRLVRDGLSIYDVDPDLLASLGPSTILTQDQCEVCAASLEDVESALAEWSGVRPEVVSLTPISLADVWADIARVGAVLGVAERAREVVAELTERVTAIGEATGALSRPRVACIEWIEPLMAAGNWVPELVELAGGRNLFGEAGEHSPWLDWQTLRDADPDVIIVLPCGFDIPRSRAELPALTSQAGFAELHAVRGGRVYLSDGNQYFNRPGPRLLDSLQILCEILQPEHFEADLEGTGWSRL